MMSELENSEIIKWSRMVDPKEDNRQRAETRRWYENMSKDQLIDRALWLGEQFDYWHGEVIRLTEVEYKAYALQFLKDELSKPAPKSIEDIIKRIETEMDTPELGTALRLTKASWSKSTRSDAAKKGQKTGLKAAKKSEIKEAVKKAWDAWQAKDSLYSTQSDFANEMVKEYKEEISFDTIVKKWIPTWAKEK